MTLPRALSPPPIVSRKQSGLALEFFLTPGSRTRLEKSQEETEMQNWGSFSTFVISTKKVPRLDYAVETSW